MLFQFILISIHLLRYFTQIILNEKEKERKKRDIRNFLQQIRQNRIIKRKKRDFLERMHNVQIDYEIY